MILLLLVSQVLASSVSEFVQRLDHIPKGRFQNCEVQVNVEEEGPHHLLHIYLKALDKDVQGYSLFPLDIEMPKDKVWVSRDRAFIRHVNDLVKPHVYEDFVLEWDKKRNLKFMSLRKYKSYGIYWDFEFNVKCGVSDITI